MMKRAVLPFICICLIVFSCLFYHTAKKKSAPIAVEVAEVGKKDVYNSVVLSGVVTNAGVHKIVFPADTMIRNVFVKTGQRVKKGDLLMERKNMNESDGEFAKGIARMTEQIVSVFSGYGIDLAEKINVPTVGAGLRIVSPADGVVSEVNVIENAIVRGYEIAAKISDYSKTEITADLPELYHSVVRTGQEAVITGEAFKGEYVGHVVYVPTSASKKSSLVGNESVYFPITVAVDNADAALKPGCSVSVKICTEKKPQAVVVPYDCILQDESGREIVFVCNSGVISKRRIMTGLELEHETEVVYGVDPGDILVCNPNDQLESGQKVVVVP